VDPAGGVENAQDRVSHPSLDGVAVHRFHRPYGRRSLDEIEGVRSVHRGQTEERRLLNTVALLR
jgi:hypothetical protein